MGVLVKYKNGAVLTYSLIAYAPYEGYRIAFNGSKGRMELNSIETPVFNEDGVMDSKSVSDTLRVYPMFGKAYDVPFTAAEGGHGGGDPVLQNDLFGTPVEDRFHRAANHVDGAMSILTGIAANQSIATGRPVDVDTLVRF